MVHPECLWCVLNLSVRVAVDVHGVMFERGLDATFDAAQHSPRHQRRDRPGELDLHQVATATCLRATAHQQPAAVRSAWSDVKRPQHIPPDSRGLPLSTSNLSGSTPATVIVTPSRRRQNHFSLALPASRSPIRSTA
jgi:hypothetical protein